MPSTPRTAPATSKPRATSAKSTCDCKLNGPEPTISESAIAVMASGQFISGEKAKRALNFTSQVSVDEAIERTLAWFKKLGLVTR
jgi:nucleoside-diphosphate-sugar epimerase